MDKLELGSGARRSGVACGQAERRTSGRAAALDLSQGHIGTTEPISDETIQVQHFGPFRVVFDLQARVGTVYSDASAFSSRAERREAERRFLKLSARMARGMPLTFAKGGKA
ncbi:MAG: hypothetical protein KIS62_05585 [Ramlibacter sp.]|nr:hypothetical protein [Ramlibacter sp.]